MPFEYELIIKLMEDTFIGMSFQWSCDKSCTKSLTMSLVKTNGLVKIPYDLVQFDIINDLVILYVNSPISPIGYKMWCSVNMSDPDCCDKLVSTIREHFGYMFVSFKE